MTSSIEGPTWISPVRNILEGSCPRTGRVWRHPPFILRSPPCFRARRASGSLSGRLQPTSGGALAVGLVNLSDEVPEFVGIHRRGGIMAAAVGRIGELQLRQLRQER